MVVFKSPRKQFSNNAACRLFHSFAVVWTRLSENRGREDGPKSPYLSSDQMKSLQKDEAMTSTGQGGRG